jgi:plasmid stabilization system protein ParE
MPALVKHPLVDCDVEEAALWYLARNPQVADRFIEEVRSAMLAAGRDPLRFPVLFAEVRRVRIHQFPHSVFFRVQGDTVFVLAVLHGSREVQAILTGRTPRSDES